MRYFKAPTAIAQAMRLQVMQLLGQPNGQADEPWSVDGDFIVDGEVYLALGPHHTEGEFWESILLEAFNNGIEEIFETEYITARGDVSYE